MADEGQAGCCLKSSHPSGSGSLDGRSCACMSSKPSSRKIDETQKTGDGTRRRCRPVPAPNVCVQQCCLDETAATPPRSDSVAHGIVLTRQEGHGRLKALGPASWRPWTHLDPIPLASPTVLALPSPVSSPHPSILSRLPGGPTASALQNLVAVGTWIGWTGHRPAGHLES